MDGIINDAMSESIIIILINFAPKFFCGMWPFIWKEYKVEYGNVDKAIKMVYGDAVGIGGGGARGLQPPIVFRDKSFEYHIIHNFA